MHITAIVCEYNPMHNGHVYHIERTRELGSTHIVAIMSSNFVQRGEPAIISKEARTKMALSCGVDLVLELPSVWSMSTAERFAYSSIYILDKLNVIDSLSFGSEEGNIDNLVEIADFLNLDSCLDKIKNFMKLGISFASSREMVIKEVMGEEYSTLISKPNNILAIEYIKALKKLDSNIKPMAIKRQGAEHDSDLEINSFLSAKQIRQYINDKNYSLERFLPKAVLDIINQEVCDGKAPSSIYNLERAILYKLRSASKDEIRNIFDVSEGLENRILSAAARSKSLDELYENIKSKRYSLARIRRVVMSSLLGINKQLVNLKPQYVRVLGFNSKGLEILKLAKDKSKIPIVTKASDMKSLNKDANLVFRSEMLAGDIYNLTLPKVFPCSYEATRKIIKFD